MPTPTVPPAVKEPAPELTAISPELAAIIAALGLSPAEGEAEVSQEAILARIGELTTSATSAGETATSLATAQAELEKVRGEYQALYEREEAARRQVEEAAVDEILAQYKDRLTSPEATARLRGLLRGLLLADREAGMEILKGIAAPVAAPAAAAEEPPKPMHTPPGGEGEQAATPEQKLAEANKLIAELRKAKPDIALRRPWSSNNSCAKR